MLVEKMDSRTQATIACNSNRKSTSVAHEVLNRVEPKSTDKTTLWKRFVFDPAGLIPPAEPIYDGLLAKGDLAVYLGREKHRKSSVLLQFAICAALGRPFLHFKFHGAKPLKVVLLDYESKSQTLKLRYASVVEALGLSVAEQEILRNSLQLVEMRKAFRAGVKHSRFPVRPEKGREAEFDQAEQDWRGFIRGMPADLYIIDPMRCMHAQGENDSTLEALLTRVHELFGDAAVVISHHLRKRDRRADKQRSLKGDMRVWADEARGSSAITAHSDVIICQERTVEDGIEILHLGAYSRDSDDIEPLMLRESAPNSFFWEVAPDVPLDLFPCVDELKRTGQEFPNKAAAVKFLMTTIGSGRTTSYSRLNELLHRKILVQRDGVIKMGESLAEVP